MGINKIRLLIMVVFSGFLLGDKVQLSTAETVARSIHLEHANLHNGNEFMVSNVETIKNEELDLIYIFHLFSSTNGSYEFCPISIRVHKHHTLWEFYIFYKHSTTILKYGYVHFY